MRKGEKVSEMLIVEFKPNSIEAESYRKLRSNIQYSSCDRPIKTIVVTSSEEGEGKSTISGNLALSFSQNGKLVILVDCDLRKSSIHKELKISNMIGLSDVLIKEAKLEEAIQKYNENLYILSAGKIPPNPSEMLSSDTMAQLINYLRTKYDVVIFDTPPVNVVTDAQILSTKADGTIIVARVGIIKPDSIKDTVKSLKNVGANIIGTILNGINCDRKRYIQYFKD